MRVLPSAFAVALLSGALAAPAFAADNGFYLGASIGQANLNIDDEEDLEGLDFDEDDLGWKVTAGVRPIDLIGAEISYIDFGSPRQDIGPVRIGASSEAIAAFGMLYLPLPVVDVYAKAGLARIETDLELRSGTELLRADDSSTDFAWGLGAGIGFGSWAVRAEYERFKLDGADPDFISVGFTYTFL